MLQRRGEGVSCVLLIVMSMLSIAIPASAIVQGREEGRGAVECAASLCISEVMPDPEGTDSNPWPNGEWVELIAIENITNLSGWALIDSSGRSADIDGNIFEVNPDGIESVFSMNQGDIGLFSASAVSSWSMKNTNGGVSLRSPDGHDVDESDWITPKSGTSLVREGVTSGPWVESTVSTPGLNGGRFLTEGECIDTVCISEVMINPTGTDGRMWPDGEWIELRGMSGGEVNWSEWGILHKGAFHNLSGMKVTSLSNESVMLLDWGGEANASALTNTHDMIALLDLQMNAIHVFEWNESNEGKSMAYGGKGGWKASQVPTPGIIGLEPNDVGRKSEIVFSRLMPGQSAGISGEWWEIESREERAIQLFGWRLKFTRPSGGVNEGVIGDEVELIGGGRLAFATNPEELMAFGGPEAIELDVVMDSAPTLTDSGGMLELFDPQGRLTDVIAYGEVSATSEGWEGGAVPTPSTTSQGLIWLRGDGCYGAADTNSSGDWVMRWRKLGGSFFCEPIHVKGEINVTPMVAPGPEALFQLIEWIDGATTSIDVQMYEFMSVHIAQALLRAELRGVDVTLLLEDSPLDETADLDMMHGYAQFLSESGVDVRLIGSDQDNDVQSPYRYLHAKIAVRDGSSIWIGSGNWKDSSFPVGDTPGNRERGVFVHNSQFASQVLERMEHDANISQPHIRRWSTGDDSFTTQDGWEMPKSDVLPTEHTLDIPPTIQVGEAELFTCPDECVNGIIGLIENAEQSLDLSVQGLSGDWEDEWGENPMIEAIEQVAKKGVRVRLLHNGYYMNANVVAMIQKFNIEWNQTLGYDTSAVLMNVNASTMKLHDKTLLIDEEVAILGSLNFAPSAFLRNREHMIVLRSNELAGWIGATFEDDWYRFDDQTDTDGDGLIDGWEEMNGFNRFRANGTEGPEQEGDQDGDGLDALDEQRWGGNPYDADTDGDCIRDDVEVMWAFREGVDVKMAVSTVDADGDGEMDNATIACDGSLIKQEQDTSRENMTGQNVTVEEGADIEGVDDAGQTVGLSILLVAGTLFLVLIIGVGISVIKGSDDD